MNTVKFTKGCLFTIGGVVILAILFGVMLNLFTGSEQGTTPTTTQASTTTQAPTTGQSPAEQVELLDAKNRGLLDANASGRGSIDTIQVKIISKTNKSLQVEILPGTMFIAGIGVQNMVVITKKSVFLEQNATVTTTVWAACANMRRSAPEETDSLELSTDPIPEDLKKLLALDDFTKSDSRIQQFAIWTITDNPKRGSYVGIGFFGIGSGPSDEEIAAIKELFQRAGISIGQYQALN